MYVKFVWMQRSEIVEGDAPSPPACRSLIYETDKIEYVWSIGGLATLADGTLVAGKVLIKGSMPTTDDMEETNECVVVALGDGTETIVAKNCSIFVMNEGGKTIDTLRV